MWTGSGPVPAHADFLLRTRVGATASVSYGVSASSGLSSSASATLGSDTASATASARGDDHTQSVPGAHLKRVTASGGVVTLSLSGNVTTDASNSLPYGKWWTQDNRSWYYEGGGNGATYANARGSASATAYPDSRDLMIGPVTNAKGPKYNTDGTVAFDANGDEEFVPTAHTLVDGAMYGDIGLAFGDPTLSSSSSANTQTMAYQGRAVGDWARIDSVYNWYSSATGNSASDTLYYGGNIPDFPVTYQRPLAIPNNNGVPTIVRNDADPSNPDHIHLRYTNGDDNGSSQDSGTSGDGADATANYYMALHLPEEFLPSKKHSVLVPGLPQDVFYKDIIPEAAAPGYASFGGGVPCTWNAPPAFWDYLGGGLHAMAEFPGVDEVPWLGLFLAASGIAVDHLIPHPDSGTANFDQGAWDDTSSTFPSAHPKSANIPWSFYYMEPRRHMLCRMHYTLKDHFDGGGYEGTTLITSGEPIDKAGEWYGNFVYAPPTTP